MEGLPFETEEGMERPWTVPAAFLGSVFQHDVSFDYVLPYAVNLAECFNLGKVEWTGRKDASNHFTVKISTEPKLLQTFMWGLQGKLETIYKLFKENFCSGDDEDTTRGKFGSAIAKIREEAMADPPGLQRERKNLSSSTYINTDNICKYHHSNDSIGDVLVYIVRPKTKAHRAFNCELATRPTKATLKFRIQPPWDFVYIGSLLDRLRLQALDYESQNGLLRSGVEVFE